MQTQLQAGTVLDGRYRIDAVLGQGGFGITYAAENTRVGLKVAVKELFWRGHSVRSEEAPPEVALADAADGPVFEAQKQRFLQEARTIRDFSDQPGIVRILDYFEANNTAYIVMEFVEGETLAAKTAAGPMPCEALLRRFLPLIDALDVIHRAGVIHRDISPENIMVQPDGSLKLIDFGAARQYVNSEGKYTSISRDSYSPGEQYDKNGRQGPWTDVYALCATLYACVCGTPPQSAIQRIFLDELQAPSSMGVAIGPAYEAIIMKGLQLRPEKRYQSMDGLARAIRAALPEDKPAQSNRRGLVIGLLVGLLCAAIAIGAWAWHRYDVTHKFRGIETETIRFEATEDTTAAEFAAAQDELRSRLEAFAGRDNYILTLDGTSIWVTLPLDCFKNQDIPVVINERFNDLIPGKRMNWWYDQKAIWEDPAYSLISGTNQVLPKALEGSTLLLRYRWNDQLTPGQRANLIVDFRARLDALGAPYAFGTAYGNNDTIVVQIGLERMDDLVIDSIGEKYPFTVSDMFGTYTLSNLSYCQLEIMEENGDATGLRLVINLDENRKKLEAFSRALLGVGMDKLYLRDNKGRSIACATFAEPLSGGVLELRDFCLKDFDVTAPENRWLLDYMTVLVNNTALPDCCTLQGWEYIDAEGKAHLDDRMPEFGLAFVSNEEQMKAVLEKPRELLETVCRKNGYSLKENDGGFWILLDLPRDDTLPEQIAAIVPKLLGELHLDTTLLMKSLYLRLSEEGEDLRCRYVVSMRFDSEKACFKNKCSLWVWGDPVEPWSEAIQQWFDSCNWASLGLEKSEF